MNNLRKRPCRARKVIGPDQGRAAGAGRGLAPAFAGALPARLPRSAADPAADRQFRRAA
jgi:hypothetical protein